MTSCTVEAINSIWTALGFGLVALTATYVAQRMAREAERAENKWLALIIGLVVALAFSGGFHGYGQDALRYGAAGARGLECVYDANHGNVRVVAVDCEPVEAPEKPAD